jgi:hypothetical protein
MKTKLAGALLAFGVVLACSACGMGGSTRTGSSPPLRAVPVARYTVPVTRTVVGASGSGSKTLGTFALRGKVSVNISCRGTGSLTVDASTSSGGTVCPEAHVRETTRAYHGRARINVDAPLAVHWTVTIQESYSQLATLQQLPIRRTGVGSESLGVFAMHGWLYVKATCVGTGKFGIRIAATSSKNAMSTYPTCRNSTHKPTIEMSSNFAVDVHRAQITVSAPVGMKWTLIAFEGPPDTGPRTTNVW